MEEGAEEGVHHFLVVVVEELFLMMVKFVMAVKEGHFLKVKKEHFLWTDVVEEEEERRQCLKTLHSDYPTDTRLGTKFTVMIHGMKEVK